MSKLIHGDCLTSHADTRPIRCVFADPPDNLGLAYGEYSDSLRRSDYLEQLEAWFLESTRHAPIVWLASMRAGASVRRHCMGLPKSECRLDLSPMRSNVHVRPAQSPLAR